MNNIIVALFAVLTLSGCNIYKSFQRTNEAPNVGENLYRNGVVEGDTTTLASLSWRELFKDNHLQGLIDEALENNSNLTIARLRVNDAEASLTAARLAFLPSLSLAPQGSAANAGGVVVPSTYSIPVQASWEIDIFGKLRNSKEQAKAALEQSRAYAQAVQTQLIATVANSYYSLLTLDRQRDISIETISNWEENIRIMEALKRNGMANEAGVAQARANKIALEANLVTIHKQIEELENSICAILGKESGKIVRGTLEEQTFPEEVSVGVSLQLLSNRPDVYQAEYYLAQMFYATNESRSAFYPSITLNGSGSWSNNYGGTVVNPGSWLVNVVAQALQPIFNRGTLKARLKISKSQQEQALLQYKQTVLDAANEVNNGLLMWQSARKRLVLNGEQQKELQTALRSAELLMKHSSSNYLEVLTAQNTLLQAELTGATDKYNEIQGVITLYRSLGGGK